MISSPSTPFALVPFALDGSQPSSNPLVQLREDVSDAVFEISHPSPAGPVDLLNDLFHRAATGSPGFGPEAVFEFVQALLTRPSVAPLEVVAQKIKTSPLTRLDATRFGWVQDQPRLFHPLAHVCQSSLGLFLAFAQNDEVLRLAYHLPAPLGHQMVQRVEINISQ